MGMGMGIELIIVETIRFCLRLQSFLPIRYTHQFEFVILTDFTSILGLTIFMNLKNFQIYHKKNIYLSLTGGISSLFNSYTMIHIMVMSKITNFIFYVCALNNFPTDRNHYRNVKHPHIPDSHQQLNGSPLSKVSYIQPLYKYI